MKGVVLGIGIIAVTCGTLFFVLKDSLPAVAPASAPKQEGSLRMPKELENIQIEDKAGVQVPLDIAMTNQDGKAVVLKDYFRDGDNRPAILTIGYYGCPMLCSLVLNGMLEGLKGLSYDIGEDYRIISVSIDDREQPELARKKRDAYAEALSVPEKHKDAWNFHVMSAVEAKRLSDTVGFNYYFDKKNDQFAHGAGFFVLSPEGVLTRTLFGISFTSSDIKLSLSEAADGKIGSFVDKVLLSCFHYDPDSHRYGIYIFGVMRLGGILTILILGTVLLLYFRGERKREIPLA